MSKTSRPFSYRRRCSSATIKMDTTPRSEPQWSPGGFKTDQKDPKFNLHFVFMLLVLMQNNLDGGTQFAPKSWNCRGSFFALCSLKSWGLELMESAVDKSVERPSPFQKFDFICKVDVLFFQPTKEIQLESKWYYKADMKYRFEFRYQTQFGS